MQRAPALCGVWGRVSVASLTLACAMRGDRDSNLGPSDARKIQSRSRVPSLREDWRRRLGSCSCSMFTRGGGGETAVRAAAAPRAGGEEGRERRSGSCPAQWRTRRGDGETVAHRRLFLARMGNRGGGGGASAAAASTGGAGERVRAGRSVFPASAPAKFLCCMSGRNSDCSCKLSNNCNILFLNARNPL